MGKPGLLNYSGWQREVLDKNYDGFGVDQYDVDQFADHVTKLASGKNDIAEMGRNARKLAEEVYSKTKLINETLRVINSLQA